MTAVTAQQTFDWRPMRRALRSPKGNLLAVLGALALVAAFVAGPSLVVPRMMDAVGAAALTDIFIQRIERKVWVFPTAGILSGLIVALVLSPYDSFIIAPATAILAITSKHMFRARLANIFNPAAFALVLAAVLFDAGHSWWGALPDWSWAGALIVLIAGGYTANRINKVPLVLAFLGTFYGLFTIASFSGTGADVGSVFRAPDFQAALFFALFMLDDPPTCPVKYRDQVIFSVIVGVVAFASFEYFGWLYYLLAGLLVGNAWWAIQRTVRARRREQARVATA
jgi:Na+-translocating ferredoxin:NAD+ oxidoreductase RnfD subunit